MKKLLVLVAVLGFALVSALSAAEAKTGSDARFVDGNWFSIAKDAGTGFGAPGDTTVEDLKTQIEAYDSAVEDDNTAEAERLAVRSWVKGMYALELGRRAIKAGDLASAKAHYERAKVYGKAAQKKNAGLGEKNSGESLAQGKSVVKYANRALSKLKKLMKDASPADEAEDKE